MKLEDIENLWAVDSKMDRTQLDVESLRIPELHQKYYKIFIRERVQLKAEENDYATFYNYKVEYYQGILDKETLDKFGWEPFQLNIIKADIPRYIDADREVQERKLKIHVTREKVDFLESIIKTLNTRGFAIKNAIDFIKFLNGGN